MALTNATNFSLLTSGYFCCVLLDTYPAGWLYGAVLFLSLQKPHDFGYSYWASAPEALFHISDHVNAFASEDCWPRLCNSRTRTTLAVKMILVENEKCSPEGMILLSILET